VQLKISSRRRFAPNSTATWGTLPIGRSRSRGAKDRGCGDRDCYEFRAAARNAAGSGGANQPQRRTAARLADPILPGRDACETSTSVNPLLPRHSVEVRNVCRRLLRQTPGHAHQGDHQNARAPASNKCHDQPPNRNHSCPRFPWSRKLPVFLPRSGCAD